MNNNARTALELPNHQAVDPVFQRTLNDRMRTIAARLDAAQSTTVVSGGSAPSQLILAVAGTLAINSNAAPVVSLPAAATPTAVVAFLKVAPQGVSLQAQINVGGTPLFTVTIGTGQTQFTQQGGFSQIAANAPITLALVQVGTTFPGSDLTVIVRF